VYAAGGAQDMASLMEHDEKKNSDQELASSVAQGGGVPGKPPAGTQVVVGGVPSEPHKGLAARPPQVDYRSAQAQREAEAAHKPNFFTIYKRGLGYTTRMGTLAGAALLTAVTAQFLYDYLPTWGLAKRPALPFFSVIGAVIAAFAITTFFITNRPNVVDFLIATDSEMKKVNWTTRKELIGSTKVVIFFVILLAVIMFVLDTFFGEMFHLMNVLKFGPFGGG
jgi:preprotein translocase SecE subunit